MIGELRRELQQAMDAGQGQPLRFELGPVELEATVAIEKGGGGGAKVRFWVIEPGRNDPPPMRPTVNAERYPFVANW